LGNHTEGSSSVNLEVPMNQRSPFYVVGIDGSAASLGAARWAASRAVADGADLVLVHAYLIPAVPSVAGPIRSPELRGSAHRRAMHLLEAVAERLPTGTDAQLVAAEGAADRVLVEQAASADLLVLGARPQHRRPHTRFIGSTASRCLRHAECPVVLIPALPSANTADARVAEDRASATA
jgi:nucleotide-binding universal stress UspA family protein